MEVVDDVHECFAPLAALNGVRLVERGRSRLADNGDSPS
jgi:hypothetical protein